MKRMKVHCISLSAFMLVGGLSAPGPAEAQDAKQPYASMAPVDEYLRQARFSGTVQKRG
jgi:hypothetical protein